MSGAVPPPAARPLERAARVPRPVCSRCGRCGHGDPAPAPQRAPLRAGVARCGVGGRASPGGGAFHPCEGRLRSGAVPPPTARPLGGLLGSATHVLWARVCGCGGPPPSPWPACPFGGCVPRGWWKAVPGGGWPATVVRGVWYQAPFLPRPPVLWSGQPGFRDPCVPGAVGAGVGTQHRPHSVRPCGPALLAVGVAEGRPRGGCLPSLSGACEVRRCPSTDCPPTGRAVGVRRPRAVGAGVGVSGPNTVSLACMPCGGCVPRGWWGAVPGGGAACHRCEGRLVSGAVPPPAARPLERAAGAPRPVCPWCGPCGRGEPAPAPQRAPLQTGVARCGGGGEASPGGVPSAVVRGVCGQALPLPRLPALWACCWGPSPTCRRRGCVGVGAQHCPLGLYALWPCTTRPTHPTVAPSRWASATATGSSPHAALALLHARSTGWC